MKRNLNIKFSEKSIYKIIVQGKIDKNLSDFLGGMQVETELISDSKYFTTLTGVIADQAALSGILNTIYEYHLSVVSVECIDDNSNNTL